MPARFSKPRAASNKAAIKGRLPEVETAPTNASGENDIIVDARDARR